VPPLARESGGRDPLGRGILAGRRPRQAWQLWLAGKIRFADRSPAGSTRSPNPLDAPLIPTPFSQAGNAL